MPISPQKLNNWAYEDGILHHTFKHPQQLTYCEVIWNRSAEFMKNGVINGKAKHLVKEVATVRVRASLKFLFVVLFSPSSRVMSTSHFRRKS